MSFVKIHQSIYDGTLRESWQALVTFKVLLVLADSNGHVDMTLYAIHSRTGIPVEILQEGIKVLESPDKVSRTPDEQGRRIMRLDEHRDWGWNVVNYVKYRESKDLTNADRQKRWRSRNALRNGVTLRNVTACNASESVSLSDSVPVGECEGKDKVLRAAIEIAAKEAPPVELPRGFPETAAAAMVHAEFVGCPPLFAETTWTKASSRGGRDAKDVPIRSFRHYLANEWVYERGRQEKEKRNGHETAATKRDKFNDPKKYEKGF